MSNNLHKGTLEKVQEQGVSFHIVINNQHGYNEECLLDVEELLEWIANPEEWEAAYFGLSPDAYSRWCDRHGSPQCAATTKRGTRCKAGVAGTHIMMDAAQFARYDGGYCKLHGGSD